jgi:hypothetical protein
MRLAELDKRSDVQARHGIVYIDYDAGRVPRYAGYWEQVEPPRMLEAGPGWQRSGDAIDWAQVRAEVVVVRVGGSDHSVFSAGERQAYTRADGSGSPYPPWAEADWSD